MNTRNIDYTDLFSKKSDAYAKFRPGYGQPAIDKILEPFAGKTHTLAVDIGAGTGIASRLLADEGVGVVGIEPNMNMIKAAAPHCRVQYKQATAENTSLASNTADLVTCFQAFHWFDFKKSLKEFNRILKQSGRLALVWNYWDEDDEFTFRYSQLINKSASKNPHRVAPYPKNIAGYSKKWRIRFLWKFRISPYFSNIHRYTFKYSESMCSNTLIGCAKSQSYILHNGSEWDRLCTEIKDLCSDYDRPKLAHNINVFIGKPDK